MQTFEYITLSQITLHYTHPCGFGVGIIPLYPPACRKRRLIGDALLSIDNVPGH